MTSMAKSLLAGLLALMMVFAHVVALEFNFDQYKGQQILRCELKDKRALENFIALKERFNLDLWTHHFSVGSFVDVRGSIAALAALRDILPCTIYADSVSELLIKEAETSYNHLQRRGAEADFFDAYHTFDELMSYYKDLVARYPKLTTWVPSIGQSIEGRDISVLHIKSKANPAKTIWYNGCIHAREWISPATVAYITTKLLEGYGVDNATTTIVDRFEIVVAPCINPDGYSYSWTNDRLWRKNRNTNNGNRCLGVDLNRNFNNHWGGVGASSNPCAEDYRGPSSSSEPETKAVQNYVLALKNRAAGIDFHSYGQLILRSFGYTYSPSNNEAILKQVGDGMRDVIFSQSGKRYTSQRAAELYPTTGSTDDWYTEQAGMWGWTIELRDLGAYGFRLPADQIRPTGEEIWAAFKYFTEQVWQRGPASN